jgi:hypothetical protein
MGAKQSAATTTRGNQPARISGQEGHCDVIFLGIGYARLESKGK